MQGSQATHCSSFRTAPVQRMSRSLHTPPSAPQVREQPQRGRPAGAVRQPVARTAGVADAQRAALRAHRGLQVCSCMILEILHDP